MSGQPDSGGPAENSMRMAPNAACLAGVLVLCLGILPAFGAAPKLDSPTPEILILGAMQEGRNLRLKVEIRNFEMNEDEYTPLAESPSTQNPPHYGLEEQRPNFGHIRVYLSPYNLVKPSRFAMVDFMMVDELSSGDVGAFLPKDVEPGRYRLLVELVKHDHSPRLKVSLARFSADGYDERHDSRYKVTANTS